MKRRGLPANLEDLPLVRGMRTLRQAAAPEPIPAGRPGGGWIADARQDLVCAVRMLRKNPGFAAAAILMLALGIGVKGLRSFHNCLNQKQI